MKSKLELNYDFYKILSLGALNTLILLFLAYFNSENENFLLPFFIFVGYLRVKNTYFSSLNFFLFLKNTTN